MGECFVRNEKETMQFHVQLAFLHESGENEETQAQSAVASDRAVDMHRQLLWQFLDVKRSAFNYSSGEALSIAKHNC